MNNQIPKQLNHQNTMYSLDEIVAMNRSMQSSPVAPVRHCSFHEGPKGIVLHSVNQRATVFLDGQQARAFKRKVSRMRGPGRRDSLIESYFQEN